MAIDWNSVWTVSRVLPSPISSKVTVTTMRPAPFDSKPLS